MLNPASFFDLDQFAEQDIFSNCIYAWDALKQLSEYTSRRAEAFLSHRSLSSGVPLLNPLVIINNTIKSTCECTISYGDATKGKLVVTENGHLLEGASVIMAGATLIGKKIKIGKGVLVEPGAYIKEPVIIGDNTEIRQGAYIRGECIIGKRCVVGHTTEVKHSIFLDDAKAGHFAYIGDSILGNNVNLGAGTKLANLKFMGGTVSIKTVEDQIDSGLKKIGAILGDDCQTGCNAVTSPGAVFGKGCLLMPNATAASGFHPAKKLLR